MLALIALTSICLANASLGCRPNLPPQAEYVEGEALVKFRPDVSSERMNEIHRSMGSRVLESWRSIRWHRVLLRQGITVPEAIRAYKRLPEVEDAEPNFTIRLTPPPHPPEPPASQ